MSTLQPLIGEFRLTEAEQASLAAAGCGEKIVPLKTKGQLIVEFRTPAEAGAASGWRGVAADRRSSDPETDNQHRPDAGFGDN